MANFSHLCLNCMKPLPDGLGEQDPCPFCGDMTGEPNPPLYLQAGTVLSERYLVGRMQRAAGDAAVYAGFDTVLKSPIVIREFLPQALCERNEDDTLRAVEGCEQVYETYLRKFLVHARTVARMRDLPASIPIYDIFQQNVTAYTVCERCEGVTLETYLQEHGGRLTWEDARPLFIPFAASMISLHQAGVYHLGLSPENLVLADDRKLHIGNFALPDARMSSSELKPDLAAGYAAPEQYSFGAECDAATDVYGLAAVIFRTLVGSPPPDGADRSHGNSDLVVPEEVAAQLPPHVAKALFDALQPDAEKRLSSVAQLRDRLAEAPAVAALLDDMPADGEPVHIEDEEEEEEPRSHRTLYIVLVIAGFVILLTVIAALWIGGIFKGDDEEPQTKPTGSVVIDDNDDEHRANTEVEVPNLVGKPYEDYRGKDVDGQAVLLDSLVYSDTAEAGTILSQSPAGGEMADITDPIKVVISAGPEYTTLADLTGWELDHAIAYAKALGLRVEVDEVAFSDQEAGKIDGTSPAANAKVTKGDMIRLRVSTATTTTTQPPTTTAAANEATNAAPYPYSSDD